MAEYLNVEKPFLDKLRQLGWQVIDQGQGIPQDATKSLRSDFKEVTLTHIAALNLSNVKNWAKFVKKKRY